jgi:uncharacterized protein (DUF427 family)
MKILESMKAIWNKQVIAESDDIVNVEGNAYFPVKAINKEFLKESDTETVCHWKGTASYYDLKVEGAVNQDAAWYYTEPRPLADGIKGRVAFWKGVEVVR